MHLITQVLRPSLPRFEGKRLTHRERGFTLLELMVVVAIIGILAGLAISRFGGTQKKATAKSEVVPMFAEFKVKQEEFRLESGSYMSSSATNAEGDTWPVSPSTDGSKQTLLPYPAPWTTLRMAPETSAVRCAYVMIVGEGGDSSTVGTIASTTFNFVAPPDDWYYVLAQCDMDQNSTTDSFYFQQSNDAELYFANQGK